MESKHLRYRAELAVIRNSIELNQYAQAKNEVLDVLNEEEWICPVYYWLLNRLNDDREMGEFVSGYTGSNPQILFEIAKYYYFREEYNDALKILKSFPEENKTPELFMLWALVCANVQENNDAIKNIKKCIELDSSFADAYILWASLIKKEDAKEAVRLLMKAKTLDVKNPKIYYELSAISEMKDDFLLSAKYLKEYIRLSGDESLETMMKLPVFLNYVENKEWENEYFEMIRKIQNNPPKENISISILIMPKHMEYTTIYRFHYEEGKCYMEKNGRIISDVIDSEYDFGIGKFASPTNNRLIKFVGSNLENPARVADDFVEVEAFSPVICCFPKSCESYNKIIQEVLETKSFRLNHEYSEHCNEYIDYKGAIKLEIEEKNGNVYGILRITDKLKYNFTINNVSEGYKGFCETINNSPFREAVFIIATKDEVYQTFFNFTTDQIEIRK